MGLTDPLTSFAEEVGKEDPVCVVGGRTQWAVGGLPDGACREVRAPAGVISHLPAEMTVRVRAATPVAALAGTLAEAGQMVPLDPGDAEHATVGGVLAVGHSGIRRLRYGPVRDSVLEIRFVTADGVVAKAGGPVVKNVSGFDLCRLLVGSLGTLGLLAEVVLRVQPRPAASRWFSAEEAEPYDLYRRLYRPSSILWDGRAVWVLLEGHPDDVAGQAAEVLGPAFREIDRAPELPGGGRVSLAPGERPPGTGWLLEVGTGTAHTAEPVACLPQPDALAALNRAIKARFDPEGRLNPGRLVG
jgi:glycolate oxidase FAD binding subunit